MFCLCNNPKRILYYHCIVQYPPILVLLMKLDICPWKLNWACEKSKYVDFNRYVRWFASSVQNIKQDINSNMSDKKFIDLGAIV